MNYDEDTQRIEEEVVDDLADEVGLPRSQTWKQWALMSGLCLFVVLGYFLARGNGLLQADADAKMENTQKVQKPRALDPVGDSGISDTADQESDRKVPVEKTNTTPAKTMTPGALLPEPPKEVPARPEVQEEPARSPE
ncbi:MAG: hypothetical protein KDB07_10520, partial [Planctomycetes bacterium]|nr:hypothetical protein [Planctomycetota bacterium]